jgi:hypothetical protein
MVGERWWRELAVLLPWDSWYSLVVAVYAWLIRPFVGLVFTHESMNNDSIISTTSVSSANLFVWLFYGLCPLLTFIYNRTGTMIQTDTSLWIAKKIRWAFISWQKHNKCRWYLSLKAISAFWQHILKKRTKRFTKKKKIKRNQCKETFVYYLSSS